MDEATRKAAVLVAALDPNSADELLERMDSQQAQQVRNAVMELQAVSSNEEASVLSDFLRCGRPNVGSDQAGVELDHSLVDKFSEPPSSELPEPAEPAHGGESERFWFLREATIDSLANYLGSENPQVIAVVVAHLPPERAAELVKQFDAPVQVDVLRRVADMDRADTAALVELEQSLQTALADEIRAARNRSTGTAAVASILSAAGTDRQQLLENLARYDKDLAGWLATVRRERDGAAKDAEPAAELSAKREPPDSGPDPPPAATPARQPAQAPEGGEELVADEFAQLWSLPNRQLADLLRHVPRDLLLLALAGASPAVVKRVLQPLPAPTRRELRRKMAQLGPLRLSDIEEAQRRVVEIARQVRGGGALPSPGRQGFAAAA